LVQSCNLAERNHMELLAEGLKYCKSLEYVDFQCCDIDVTHAKCFSDIIKEQYEMKDGLKWRLGLRNPEYINIS
jgi:hypothetical protein